ncbi:heterokaryon incompatibility protein-domain-containing protein, partial [Lophiotrema nucula]
MNHARCGAGSPQPLPERILDIHGDNVRLVEIAGETARYVGVSHCWGAHSLLKTTTANISTFRKSIPWESIPRTFQEAVIFTRRLGIRYIWIDSLCIIQDDETFASDWQVQSAKMAAIYQNSYVTLAASRSSDSTKGFLQTLKIALPFSNDLDLSDITVYARLDIPHVAWAHYHDQFLLMLRAWAYQERLLSPRMIHFAGLELQWECGQRTACQCGVSNHPGIENLGAQSSTSSEYRHKVEYGRHIVVSTSPGISWRRFFQRYASLALTYPSDIFPALSGLAASWNAHGNDRYLAGLWSNSLLHDLLWS